VDVGGGDQQQRQVIVLTGLVVELPLERAIGRAELEEFIAADVATFAGGDNGTFVFFLRYCKEVIDRYGRLLAYLTVNDHQPGRCTRLELQRTHARNRHGRLAGRRTTERWVIDQASTTGTLLKPTDYHTIEHMENRLYIPSEHVRLFENQGSHKELSNSRW
jgi:hypothetical protein